MAYVLVSPVPSGYTRTLVGWTPMALPQTSQQLHFVLFPFMAPGHIIPMIDIAKLLAQHGAVVTIVTTPHNAARFSSTLARAEESGLPIRLAHLRLPCAEAGLPEGCENIDMLPSLGLIPSFFTAISMLQEEAENLFQDLTPRPSCMISDMCLLYTSEIANKFHIPRIIFHGFGCFGLLCHLICAHTHSEIIENISSESEYFALPGLPDEIEFTKAQLSSRNQKFKEFREKLAAYDLSSYGAIINSFEELEPAYAKEYRKARGSKIWCVGPVSLSNKEYLDKAQRGNNASIDERQCLKWLDSQETTSVIYACLGSLCNLTPSQLKELGLGLEASKRPFIWVIRGYDKWEELDKWISESGFEERIKDRGFLIRGWSPQLLILSHPATGGFLTHCGWNSTLEGVSAGIPMITWPLFADQFFNEKLVVQILKIGVGLGVERAMSFGDEEKIGLLVKKEDIEKAVDMLFDEGKEGKGRRERAREIGEMAKRAVEEGGSSHNNITMLIQDIIQETHNRSPGR